MHELVHAGGTVDVTTGVPIVLGSGEVTFLIQLANWPAKELLNRNVHP